MCRFQFGSVSPLMRLHGHRNGGPPSDPVCMQVNLRPCYFSVVPVQCTDGRPLLPILGLDFVAVVFRLVRPTVTMSRGLSLTRLTTTTQSYRRFGSGTNCAITSWTPRQVTVSRVLRSTHVHIQYTHLCVQATWANTNAPMISPIWLMFPGDPVCAFVPSGDEPACGEGELCAHGP